MEYDSYNNSHARFLTFVISNRDQKVSNVITTIIVIVPRPALKDLLLIFSNEPFIMNESPIKMGHYINWNTNVRISVNSK